MKVEKQMMYKEIIETAYEAWLDSEDYSTESAIENSTVKAEEKILMSFIGKENYINASDYITHIEYLAERYAFEQGFRRGIMLLLNMANKSVPVEA